MCYACLLLDATKIYGVLDTIIVSKLSQFDQVRQPGLMIYILEAMCRLQVEARNKPSLSGRYPYRFSNHESYVNQGLQYRTVMTHDSFFNRRQSTAD